MARLRQFIVPGLLTLVMLAVLIALGTWQMHRLSWKQALLDRIEAAERAPAIALPPNPSPFQKVKVSGQLEAGRWVWYGAEVRDSPTGPQLGAHLIQPLEREGSPPLLVDRGWAPSDYRPPAAQPGAEVTIEGYVHPPARLTWLLPKPDPANRHVYTLDPREIGAILGLPDVAPYVLVALGPENSSVIPAPVGHLPRPPNNHLGYALTWYGLALVLLVIFVAWARETLCAGLGGQ